MLKGWRARPSRGAGGGHRAASSLSGGDSGRRGQSFKNIIGRDFTADGPWQKMGTDVTEFKLSFGKAYLATYITHWNTTRRHVKLKGLTPAEYRDQALREAA